MPTPTATPRTQTPNSARAPSKPTLNNAEMDHLNPSQWLNFSLPPRQRTVPGSGSGSAGNGLPRRSRRGDSWRGSALTREKYVNANFRFVLKPTMTGSYGAHFADPDISLHWPNILQVLVPTFSPLSVAQGYVSSAPSSSTSKVLPNPNGEVLASSWDSAELEGMGEEAAERRRRIEEEKMGRSCPICLGRPVAGRMTKCGHIFCFPCILHYIQLSDIPKSAKCPICGDTVHEGMLKSVRYLDADTMLRSTQGDDDLEASSPIDPAHESASGHGVDHDHTHGVGVMGEMDGFEDRLSVPHPPSASVAEDKDDSESHSRQIHMRLIQRPQMTTMALPTSPTWPSEAVPPHTAPWHFLPDILTYSHFMLATPSYMFAELSRELTELRAEWELMKGDDLGREFVKAAREKVERQVGKVKAELDTDGVKRGEREVREAWGEAVGGEKRERERRKERERRAREREEIQKSQKESGGEIPMDFLSVNSNTFNPGTHFTPAHPLGPNPMPHLLNSISENPSPSKKNRKKTTPGGASAPPPSPPSPSYYFYQSTLGVNVFLHPLDIRILLSHFKSYSLFPTTISFTSSGSDPATINDELRKRCKYLAHLPSGTEVVFVEAELEEIVGKQSLIPFEQALKARKGKRKDRIKKEDKAKSRWEKSEREKIPVDTRSALAAGGQGPEDREFALAIARSTLDTNHGYRNGWSSAEDSSAYLGSSPNFHPGSASSSTSFHYPQPTQAPLTGLSPPLGTSPSAYLQQARQPWSSQPTATPTRPSFATALNSRSASSTPIRKKEDSIPDWEVEEAWGAFTRLNAGDGGDGGDDELSRGSVRESEGGKRGKKKTKKLVLGGGGGRRA